MTENVSELAEYGLIELHERGRAKQPRVWYDEIEFSGDVSLHDLDGGSDRSTAAP